MLLFVEKKEGPIRGAVAGGEGRGGEEEERAAAEDDDEDDEDDEDDDKDEQRQNQVEAGCEKDRETAVIQTEGWKQRISTMTMTH